jgi:putative sigma-54 modulation protein
MNVEYTGRQTVITAKLKEQAMTGLARVEKVANRCTGAHVVLTEDKYRKIAEITVPCKGEQLVAVSESTEMETALHDALMKVEQQAIKHRKRWDTMRMRGPSKELQVSAA